MSEEVKQDTEQSAPTVQVRIPENLGRVLMEPLNHAIAAGTREALKIGTPAHIAIEILLNHLVSVVAMIEPAGAREACVKDIVRSITPMLAKHVAVRHTSPGGVLLPGAD